jgi:hypothetical protein
MRKLLPALLLLLTALLLKPDPVLATPGDTTRVTIFNQRALTRYGLYDTTAQLPPAGRRYRKILLHYILGRYACAPGSQYCGSWDYTTRLILRPPAHDTVEMARIITPYATDWLARNKTHDYVVDVTDYAPLLVGNRSMQFDYQGFSWGFTVTLRLDFIEGTPPQDPIDVRNAYAGTFAYGKTTDPIENHLPARSLTAPSTGTLTLKNLISGHGSDPVGCAEFCRRYYWLLINGQQQYFTFLWRDDCGRNEVYPQTGTWVYERGNWCPGAVVRPLWHDLTSLTTPGQPFTLDLNMQSHTIPDPTQAAAQYIWSSQLVSRGPINFSTDAALDEIIAPNSNENYYRENPSCGGPQVRLRNLGSSSLTSATIAYRVLGRGATQTYSWTGTLPFGRDTLVVLPPLASLLNNAGGSFQAWVASPNGTSDLNHFNDTLTSRFAATASLPARFVVSMTTNNARAVLYNQTSWQVIDVAGNVIKQRVNAANLTTYRDTVSLQPGCYRLQVSDTGCDGFAWWAAPAVGNGSMRLLDNRNSNVLRTIDGDFGCEYTLNFRVAGSASATVATPPLVALDLYPNPSQDGYFTLDLNLPTRQDLRLRLLDALGRVSFQQDLPQVKAVVQPLDLHRQAPGVYVLEATAADGTRLHRRLVIE